MSETRKLAAILVADVVGYSRLAGADEDRTLARLRGLRSDLIDPAIAAHHGRIVKRTGDGSITEFRSVVHAVRCAIEVQNGLIERNAGVPEVRRIQFRVGIHVGDVVEESDGDLIGDGVNIAAWLEGVAKPGTICLSGDAYRHVRDRLKENFIDLGEKQFKNIARRVRGSALTPAAINGAQVANPATTVVTRKGGVSAVQTAVAVAVALALIVTGWLGWRTWSLPRESPVRGVVVNDILVTAPRLSIVAPPFEDLSGDKKQDYFADGITDDLTTSLSHLSNSSVIARNTAFTYKRKPVDAKEIGRQLDVRYVLEGSARRVGETVTVNAQLISAVGQTVAVSRPTGLILAAQLGPIPGPAPSGGDRIVTRANQGQTLHLAVGEAFILRLGAEIAWDVRVTNPQVVIKLDAPLAPGEQGEYRANMSGVAELLAVALPPCADDQPPCRVMAPAFRILLEVR
jgi:adenylate cyclase